MDITTLFGSVVAGSSPAGCTLEILYILYILVSTSGYSLVVERLVANEKAGFRLSLAAQMRKIPRYRAI